MSQKPINRTVLVMFADALFLSWATCFNASALFREALPEQMAYHDIDCQNLVVLVTEALGNDEYDLGELIELTSDIKDLKLLLESPNQDVNKHE